MNEKQLFSSKCGYMSYAFIFILDCQIYLFMVCIGQLALVL